MFIHYLKTALRNLKANAVFNIISIVCLAVGTIIFAVLEYEVDNDLLFENRLPGRDRIVAATLVQCFEDGQPDTVTSYEIKESRYYDSPAIECVFASVFDQKYGDNPGRDDTYAEMVLTEPDGTQVAVTGQFDRITSNYFKYKGMTLLYGDRLPQNRREIVVKESLLKRLNVKGDIASCVLEYCTPDGDTSHDTQLHIVNVIKDDKWSRRVRADIFYHIDGLRKVQAVLKEGYSIDQANIMLKENSFPWRIQGNTRLIVPQVRPLQDSEQSQTDIWKRLLSVLVLITGMVCYLSNLITSFIRHWHDNRLRICLGSTRNGLTKMLGCQVLVTLLPALLIAIISTLFLTPFLNTLDTWIVYYHLPYIIMLELMVTAVVFLLCILVVAIVIKYVNVSVPEKKNALSQRERNLLKYALLTIEVAISVMTLNGTITMIETVPRPYCPLSRNELKHILTLDMRNGSFDQHRDNIKSKIRGIADVDDMLTTEKPLYPTGDWFNRADVEEFNHYDESQGRLASSISTEFIFCDTNYFSFFKIPVRHMDYDRSMDGVFVSEELWNKMGDNVPEVLHIWVMDDYHYEDAIRTTHSIAGVFKERMGFIRRPYDGYFAGPFNSQHSGHYLFIKFRDGADMKAMKSSIEKICQEQIGNFNDDCIGTMGGKWLGTSHNTRIMIMLLFTAALAGVLMVLLSIISVISADTGARRKEVALRKIHGAKARDIARMFIRPYVWVLLIAFCIGYPCTKMLPGLQDTPLLTWRIPLVLFITALVITLSTVWKLRRIMRTNPSEVIKSE